MIKTHNNKLENGDWLVVEGELTVVCEIYDNDYIEIAYFEREEEAVCRTARLVGKSWIFVN